MSRTKWMSNFVLGFFGLITLSASVLAQSPARDIIIGLTCNEEHGDSKFNGVIHLIRNHRSLIDAEIVLNEGGGGLMGKNGKPQHHGIQAGENIFQNVQLEVTNVGGHSSVPTRDNAIYQLAEGLARLAKFEFPFKLSDTTRTHFERRAAMESKGTNSAIAADMRPGVPVIPTMATGGTDGRFLNNVGIWTYGVNGIFTPPEGSNAHGLNKRLPVKSLYEGHEFLFTLGKRLGDESSELNLL